VESFRGDYSEQQYLGGVITPAHLVSIVIFAVGVGLYWKLSRQKPASAA
jgi:hypothetical protein